MVLRELSQAPEIRTRRLRVVGPRRHRHEAADVRIEAEKSGQLARLDPRLRALAREIDLEERRNRQLRGRGLRRKRVAQLAELADGLRLPALEMPDEVPAERIAPACMLRLDILRAVLADDLDARLRQCTDLFDGQVLGGDDDGDALP